MGIEKARSTRLTRTGALMLATTDPLEAPFSRISLSPSCASGFAFACMELPAMRHLRWRVDGGFFGGGLVFAADGGDGFGGEFFADGADTVVEGAAFLAVHQEVNASAMRHFVFYHP